MMLVKSFSASNFGLWLVEIGNYAPYYFDNLMTCLYNKYTLVNYFHHFSVFCLLSPVGSEIFLEVSVFFYLLHPSYYFQLFLNNNNIQYYANIV